MGYTTEPFAMKRLFLEVQDAARFLDELDGGGGTFVPTRMPVSLGDRFVLAVRLHGSARAVELPVRVLGRRVARGAHGPLSSGVLVKLEDPAHPMAALLREVVAGRVVDLERRIQESARLPARAVFPSVDDALAELEALATDGAGQLPVVEPVSRGDRLAVTVSAESTGPLLSFHVLVRSLIQRDGARAALVEPVDDANRRAVDAFLETSRVVVGARATRA